MPRSKEKLNDQPITTRHNVVCLTWRAHIEAIHGEPCCRLQADVAATNNDCLHRQAREGLLHQANTWLAGTHAASPPHAPSYACKPAGQKQALQYGHWVYPAAPLLGFRQRCNDAVRVYHIAQVVDALQVRARRLEVRQADGLPVPAHNMSAARSHTPEPLVRTLPSCLMWQTMCGGAVDLQHLDLAGAATVANNSKQASRNISLKADTYQAGLSKQRYRFSCRALDRIAPLALPVNPPLTTAANMPCMPCQERTLAPTAMIRFSYVMDSPSAVLSCFLLTSTSDTWTPVRNSMSASTTSLGTNRMYH